MNKIFTPQNVVWITGVASILCMTLIQYLSKRFKPWSYILRQLGKMLNADLKERIDFVEKLEMNDQKHDISRIEAIEKLQEDFNNLYLENNMKDSRRQILKFSDELQRGIKHSQEFFNNILDDINQYQEYCVQNPNFKNKKAQIAIKYIEDSYNNDLHRNDFL